MKWFANCKVLIKPIKVFSKNNNNKYFGLIFVCKQILQKVFVKKYADGKSEEVEIVNRSCLWPGFSICFSSVLKLNWIRLLWLEVGRARPKFKEIDIYFTDSTPAKLEEVCVVAGGGADVPLFIVYRPWARPSSQQFCGHALLLTSQLCLFTKIVSLVTWSENLISCGCEGS